MPAPDYALIDQLERELDIGQPPPTPEPRPLALPVCLIKDCTGSDYDLRAWPDILLRRVHQH